MKYIQFTAANGFPAKTYSHIFEKIPDCQFQFINLVAHKNPINSPELWFSIADEIIEDIEKNNQAPVIGIGHSLGGATTFIAALKRPDLFSELILLEPVCLKPIVLMGIKLLNWIYPKGMSPLAKQARIRKSSFTSQQEAHNYFSNKAFFKNFHQDSLNAYIQDGLKPNENGFELTFSKTIEANIFTHQPKLPKKTFSKIKTHLIYGNESSFLSIFDVLGWKNRVHDCHYYFRPGGHMLCFEEPYIFADLLDAIIHNKQTKLENFKQQSRTFEKKHLNHKWYCHGFSK